MRQIFASRDVAVLATQGREYPHACFVAFVATEDLKHIFFVTGRSTRKFDNMCRDGRVMLLVDDRANTEKDFDTPTVVTGRGKAVPAHSKAVEEMLPLYLSRHPHLEAFAKKRSSVMVRVEIDSYAVVTRFQELLVLEMGSGASHP